MRATTAPIVTLALTAWAAAAAACAGPADPSADYPCLSPGPEVGNRELHTGPVWTPNDASAALAREVPGGFGGMFRDLDVKGGMVFYLLDLSQEDAAIRALRDRGHLVVTAVQGDYSYLQLKSCYDQLRLSDPELSVWQFDGLTATAISDAANRIFLGIDDIGEAPALRAVIAELDVPQEMVVIEELGPIEALTSDL